MTGVDHLEQLNRKLSTPRNRAILFILMLSIYWLRIINIDADVTPWGVTAYQPIDEGIYSSMAINLYNLGSVDPAGYYGSGVALTNAQDIVTVVLNLVTYIGMRLFGDTYLGFRIGSIVVGLVSLVLFARMVGLIFDSSETLGKYTYTAQVVGVIVYLTSFPYFNATRIVEPSLYRMLFAIILVCCYVDRKLPWPLRSFLAGFITIFSIFFVYNTNTFFGILVLGYLLYLIVTKRAREAKTYLLHGVVGALSAYLFALVYYAFWGTTPLANLIAAIGIFGGSTNFGYGNNYTITLSLTLFVNAVDFISSNVELYQIPLLALFISLLPTFKQMKSAEVSEPVVCLLLMVLGLFLQTLLVPDYIVRKEIIISPFLLTLLLIELAVLLSTKMNDKQRLVYLLFCLLGILFAFAVPVYRLHIAHDAVVTNADFSLKDKMMFMFSCGVTIVMSIMIGMAILGAKYSCAFSAIATLFVVSIGMNVLFITKYNVMHQTYTDRDAMVEIGEITNGKVVAGDYFYGYTLYNDALPLKNDRNALLPYFGSHEDAYFFDYAGADSFTNDPLDMWKTLETVEEFPRSYMNRQAADSRDVSLYRSTYKDE